VAVAHKPKANGRRTKLAYRVDTLNAETKSTRRSGCNIDEYAGRSVLTATLLSPSTTAKAVSVALYIPSVAKKEKAR
jgi:hypothetical protein